MHIPLNRKPFTEEELNVIKGYYNSIATVHGCNREYVRLIAEGEKKVNNALSKDIHKSLRILSKFLSPKHKKSK